MGNLGDLLTVMAAVAVVLAVLMRGKILSLILSARRSADAPARWAGSGGKAGAGDRAERRRG